MPLNMQSVGTQVGPSLHSYDWRDAALYALALCATDADLKYLRDRPPPQVLPTFGVLPAFEPVLEVMRQTGADLGQLLHAGQQIQLFETLPAAAELETKARLRGLWDMKVGALCVVDTESSLDGKIICKTRWDLLLRGAGGFGGERGPGWLKTRPPKGSPPRFEVEVPTRPEQALLYRLTGDINPIHADPEAARAAGLEQPILHGLCTYGIAARVGLGQLCDDDPARMSAFDARFSQVVLPGQTLVVRGYDLPDNDAAAITVQVKETGQLAIANARLDYRR